MENNWNRITRHFGDTFEGETLQFDFIYKGKLAIKSVSKSCGCIDLKLKKNRINVKWKPRDVPNHILDKGFTSYMENKSLMVIFEDETTQRLYIKCIVHEQ